jgi:hypothetical protein
MEHKIIKKCNCTIFYRKFDKNLALLYKNTAMVRAINFEKAFCSIEKNRKINFFETKCEVDNRTIINRKLMKKLLVLDAYSNNKLEDIEKFLIENGIKNG